MPRRRISPNWSQGRFASWMHAGRPPVERNPALWSDFLVTDGEAAPARGMPALVGLGLPRTGTKYLSRMVLPPHKSAHEFDSWRHCIVASEFLQGRATQSQVELYLRGRQALGQLDADVSSINGHFAHLFAQLMTDSVFVLTVRPPMEWVAAYSRSHAWRATVAPEWQSLRRARFRQDLWPPRSEDEALVRLGLPSLDGLLFYWSTHVRGVLDALSPERLVILRPEQLDTSPGLLARRLGWPESALAAHSDRHATPIEFRTAQGVIDELDEGYVADCMVRQLAGIDWQRLGMEPLP